MARDNRLDRQGWNWAPVPADVILDKKLSDFAVRLYAHLLWRSGNKGSAFPGAKSIADDFGVSIATVLRGYKLLVKNNWIKRFRRYGKSSLTCIFETKSECQSYQFCDDESIKNDMINISKMIRLNESKVNKSKINNISADEPTRKTPQQLMIETLCSVMTLEVSLNASRVARFAKQLLDLSITPEQIESGYGQQSRYYLVDWRGRKGQAPTERIIKETLKLAGDGWLETQSPPRRESFRANNAPAPILDIAAEYERVNTHR